MAKQKTLLYSISLFILLQGILGCSGYHFRSQNNPLKMYGINSVYVPLFFNKSSLPDLSGSFTKEMVNLLSTYPNLFVTTLPLQRVDAVLLGIVNSDNSYFKSISPAAEKEFSSKNEPALLHRSSLFIPQQNAVGIKLELILIKNPTNQEIELIQKRNGEFLYKNPKIVFRHTIAVGATYARAIYQRKDAVKDPVTETLVIKENTDLGGVVNGTQNLGTLHSRTRKMAEDAAFQFKEMILHAF